MSEERVAELVQIYRFRDRKSGVKIENWDFITWTMHKHLAQIQPDQDKYEYITLMNWDQCGIGDSYYFAVLRHKIDPMYTAFTDGAGKTGPFMYSHEVTEYHKAMHGKLEDSAFATKISDEYKLPEPGTEAYKWFTIMLTIYSKNADEWQKRVDQIKRLL